MPLHSTPHTKTIYLAYSQGFCSGVSRALKIVDQSLKKYGLPLYIYHHIVHNTAVIAQYEEQGVTFVENLDAIPPKSRVIFSAHGVAPSIYKKAQKRQLKYIDATCPLVNKIHQKATSYSQKNIQTILIGHKNHQEVIGTSGYIRKDLLHIIQDENDLASLKLDASKDIGILTQTTFSATTIASLIHKLIQKYPIKPPLINDNICFATRDRQKAVIDIAKKCDLVLICGSEHSSNSKRLLETAHQFCSQVHMIDTVHQLSSQWLTNAQAIGLSSGASVPSYLVKNIIDKIVLMYPNVVINALKKP
jgi:4-hydroxy-3-methylbut-2-enyl diphosphate reductase